MSAFDEKRVITYGAFDQFDAGHVALLRRLASMGDKLIIGLSTDEYCAETGTPIQVPFEARRDMLEACRYVDRVIPEHDAHQKRTDIVNYNVALFAMDERWAGIFDELSDLTQVLYIPRESTLEPRLKPQDSRQENYVKSA